MKKGQPTNPDREVIAMKDEEIKLLNSVMESQSAMITLQNERIQELNRNTELMRAILQRVPIGNLNIYLEGFEKAVADYQRWINRCLICGMEEGHKMSCSNNTENKKIHLTISRNEN